MKKLKLTKLAKDEMSKKQLNAIKGGGCWGDCGDSRACKVHDGKRTERRDIRANGKY